MPEDEKRAITALLTELLKPACNWESTLNLKFMGMHGQSEEKAEIKSIHAFLFNIRISGFASIATYIYIRLFTLGYQRHSETKLRRGRRGS